MCATCVAISSSIRVVGWREDNQRRNRGLLPDGSGGLDDARQFRPLIRFGDRIASDCAGKSALRTDRQPIEINIAGGIIRTVLEITQALEHGRFRADEAEHNTLALRDKTQRREITG